MAVWNPPMLFTRCPDCQTNFRITADALRKADGQVRCGHCSVVFNAYEALRDGGGSVQEPPTVEEPADEEFDSLSETDEYVGLGDGEPTTTTPDDAEPAGIVAADTESEDQPPTDDAHDDAQIAEDDPPTDASEPSLEFNLPPDEWTTFFQHAVEQPLAGDLPQGGGLSRPEADDATEQQPAEDIVVEEIDFDDVAELEEDAGPLPGDDAAERQQPTEDIVVKEIDVDELGELEDDEGPLRGEDADDGASRVVQMPESDIAAAKLAEAIAPDADPAWETSLVEEIESLEVEEESPQEEVYTIATEDAAVTDRADQRFQLWNLLQAHRWSVGAAVCSALLLAQAIHHFRAPIAAQPLIGPLVRAAYSTAGVEIVPDLDLTQYEIMDWVATADAGTGGPGSLQISARIHNHGPLAQPYPNVRLELKDRWEATVGSRVFTAAEYLPKDMTPDPVMDAGTTVPANLQVVDPGQDAYGFELDICAEIGDGAIRCASDTVFQ